MANRFAVRPTQRRLIASGVVIKTKILAQATIAAPNVLPVKSISRELLHHGAVVSLMMETRTNAVEGKRCSVVLTLTFHKSPQDVLTHHGMCFHTPDRLLHEYLTINDSRSSCSIGYTSVFSKTDKCLVGSQQYCCPDPVSLTACHWVGGSGGEDCSNAVCNATELEVDRAQFGGSSTGGCSCKFISKHRVIHTD